MRHLTASLSCSPDVLLLSRRFCDIRFLHAVCVIYSFREVKIDAERRHILGNGIVFEIAWYMHFYNSLNINTVVPYGQVGRSPCTESLNNFL